MRKLASALFATSFLLLAISAASAALPAARFVDQKNGNNANAAANCPITAPCADLNTALSTLTGNPNVVVIVGGGIFGPVVLNQGIDIIGTDPNELANIIADPTAQVGCIGHLPAACGLTNNGHALEFTGGSTDQLTLTHVALRVTGATGAALKFVSGNGMKVSNSLFNGSNNEPAVQIYPSSGNVGVYFAYNEVTGGGGTFGGAVEVKPTGTTNVSLHFNHVQVYFASYGIRSDGSGLTAGSFVNTTVSESEFFSINNAAVNAFSLAGTGTVNATFYDTRILNTNQALKANGPLSHVVLSGNTVTNNGTGVLVQNGAQVKTSLNNTIENNGVDVSGSLTNAPQK